MQFTCKFVSLQCQWCFRWKYTNHKWKVAFESLQWFLTICKKKRENLNTDPTLMHVLILFCEAVQSNQATHQPAPPDPVRNTHPEQCPWPLVVVRLPDAGLPRHWETVPGSLRQTHPALERRQKHIQGTGSWWVISIMRKNNCWYYDVTMRVQRSFQHQLGNADRSWAAMAGAWIMCAITTNVIVYQLFHQHTYVAGSFGTNM